MAVLQDHSDIRWRLLVIRRLILSCTVYTLPKVLSGCAAPLLFVWREAGKGKKNKLASISPLNPQISHCRVQTFFRFSTHHLGCMLQRTVRSSLMCINTNQVLETRIVDQKRLVLYLTKLPAFAGTKGVALLGVPLPP